MAQTPLRTAADVAAIVKARRRALGLDQAELAERARVSRLWVSEVENGKTGAGIGRILRTFNVLGLTIIVDDEAPKPVRKRPSATTMLARHLTTAAKKGG